MKYLIIGLFLMGALYAINITNALDRVEIDRIPVDTSKFEGIDHAS